MGFPSLFVFLLVFHLLLLKLCDSKCQKSFSCGNLGLLEYPLTDHAQPDCGLITVDCDSSIPIFRIGENEYQVSKKFSTEKFMVLDTGLQHNLNTKSCDSFSTTPLNVSSDIPIIISPNLTLFKCDKTFTEREDVKQYFKNYSKCDGFTVYYRNPADGNLSREMMDHPLGCSWIQLPMNASANWTSGDDDLFKLLTFKYTIQWHVVDYQGKRDKIVVLAAGLSAATVLIIAYSIRLLFFRKKKLAFQEACAKNQVAIELFLKNHGSVAPKLYKYSDLNNITNSFSETVGKGGNGCVYKGKLQDGRLVAVKILNESKGNGEEFLNEVSTISRTSHINVVTLLGFSFDGSKRALIYEFMPNGSLEKFIPNTSSSTPDSSLGVEKLFEIVAGIARGLEYLHQGCNTRILHFDIKPHNILLDKDFKPKISDFGLSKLYPNRSSIVSMQGTRGTVGYIAPEVFSRNFGQVSHKSDVYSYGMMVLEMVVGRQQYIGPQGERSSEIYFSDWIYKNLEQNTIEEEILEYNNISQEDEWRFVKRRLIIIGLWCIQTDPRNRPSISEVMEMLEANLESLQLPPRPYLYSSPIFSLLYSGSGSGSGSKSTINHVGS